MTAPAVSPFPFDWSRQGIVDAAGELSIEWDSGGTINWLVEQVTIEMSSAPVGSTAELRKGDQLVTPMIPTGDVAGGDPPVMLRPGHRMRVDWAGCTTGDVGKVYVIYRKVGFA